MWGFFLALRKIFLLMALVAGLSVIGCASAKFSHDADAERWNGQISGMASGDIEFFIEKTQGKGELSSVKGRFVMNLDTTAGGYGSVTVKGRIKGEVENGTMRSEIFGNAEVDRALYRISGEMIGTLSNTEASGTWEMRHEEGVHSGKWTAEKMAVP